MKAAATIVHLRNTIRFMRSRTKHLDKELREVASARDRLIATAAELREEINTLRLQLSGARVAGDREGGRRQSVQGSPRSARRGRAERRRK